MGPFFGPSTMVREDFLWFLEKFVIHLRRRVVLELFMWQHNVAFRPQNGLLGSSKDPPHARSLCSNLLLIHYTFFICGPFELFDIILPPQLFTVLALVIYVSLGLEVSCLLLLSFGSRGGWDLAWWPTWS